MKLTIPILLFVTTILPAQADGPPLYPYPAPQDITLEDIIPAAMDNLKQPGYVPGMQPGEKVLIISDRSVDPLTAEAFYVAAWRLGAGQVDTIMLQGRLDVTDPTELVREIFEKNPWPQWIWDAAAGYDRVVPLSFINPVNLMDAVIRHRLEKQMGPRYRYRIPHVVEYTPAAPAPCRQQGLSQ